MPTFAVSPRLALYLDLIRWDRPAGWLLLLWPSLSALWVAAGGFPGWHLLVVFILGTILMRSAGCCLNDVADRDFDRHVKRTAQRPVTAGKVSVREALWLGVVLALLAFVLVLTTNPVAVLWSFAALAVAMVYPYAKRFFAMPQAVLGVAFSFGIPMAFAAVWQSVPPVAWVMLLANVFWAIAYDTEYAIVDRPDDLKIGIKTSAITFGRFDVLAIMLCYLATLGLLSWVGWQFHRGPIYFAGIAIAALIALYHYWLIRQRDRSRCFKAFLHNNWIGATIFVALALDYALALGHSARQPGPFQVFFG